MVQQLHHPGDDRGRAVNPHHFRFYDTLVHVFVVVLLVSNLVAQKICALGPFEIAGQTFGPYYLSAAQALFPITYIFGDIFVEVYGYGASRRAIWIGFFSSALLAAMALFTTALPPAPEFQNQAAFEQIFGFVPRVLAASLIAYWCGEFANAFVMSKMKLLTNGKHLWMRTIGSTIVGEGLDSVLFVTVAFGGTVPTGVLGGIILGQWVAKVLYEVAATPLTYAVVGWLKSRERLDTYDHATDFNPIRL